MTGYSLAGIVRRGALAIVLATAASLAFALGASADSTPP